MYTENTEKLQRASLLLLLTRTGSKMCATTWRRCAFSHGRWTARVTPPVRIAIDAPSFVVDRQKRGVMAATEAEGAQTRAAGAVGVVTPDNVLALMASLAAGLAGLGILYGYIVPRKGATLREAPAAALCTSRVDVRLTQLLVYFPPLQRAPHGCPNTPASAGRNSTSWATRWCGSRSWAAS